MKRIFIMIFSFLLCFTLVRTLNGREPLTLSTFFKSISKLDLDFSNLKNVISYMKDMEFPRIDSFLSALQALKNIFKILVAPFRLLFALLSDIGSLLYSFVQVLGDLCGFTVIDKPGGTYLGGAGSGESSGGWSGGGHGGGGSGVR